MQTIVMVSPAGCQLRLFFYYNKLSTHSLKASCGCQTSCTCANNKCVSGYHEFIILKTFLDYSRCTNPAAKTKYNIVILKIFIKNISILFGSTGFQKASYIT